MENIEMLEKRLWDAADQLRANSKLGSNEYFMPLMGLIFLRHAFNRYLKVKAEVEPLLPRRQGVVRPLMKDDFAKKSAIYLRDEARFDHLLSLPADRDPGAALNRAIGNDRRGLFHAGGHSSDRLFENRTQCAAEPAADI